MVSVTEKSNGVVWLLWQPPSIATQGRYMSRKHQTSVLRQWLTSCLGCYDALGTTFFSWSLNNCQDLGEGSHRVGYGTVLMANYSTWPNYPFYSKKQPKNQRPKFKTAYNIVTLWLWSIIDLWHFWRLFSNLYLNIVVYHT